jgi:hypothetical protein
LGRIAASSYAQPEAPFGLVPWVTNVTLQEISGAVEVDLKAQHLRVLPGKVCQIAPDESAAKRSMQRLETGENF